MVVMSSVAYWEEVLARDCAVPEGRPLDDMTVELVELLGSEDGHLRDDLALSVLVAWVRRGVFDDLLTALGDGLCEGLKVGLSEYGTPTVFRRSFSARVLAEVVDRDNRLRSVHPETVLAWGDRGLGWLVAERDLRGRVLGCGRAQALAHGAELLRALAMSQHLDEGGLMVLLDTVADRLLQPTEYLFGAREDDRLAYATMALLHRDVVDMALLGPWIDRLRTGWEHRPVPPETVNTISFVRALHLQLLLGVDAAGPDTAGVDAARVDAAGVDAAGVDAAGGHGGHHFAERPRVRVDLLAGLQSALRTSGPYYARGPA